ncbi:MAG: porphobilinogen synthase [Deltaproteobacteria bacterium]|nr:porphobilinogen synthase [Deltaproteobacteria bacterium]
MSFPQERPRRLRQSAVIRRLVAENSLSVSQLIQPLFVIPGERVTLPIPSMPGINQYSVDTLVEEAKTLVGSGVLAALIFGTPETKDANASRAYAEDGIVQRTCRALRETVPELWIITDVCLCAYMSHGHCGIVRERSATGAVDNDSSLELLAKTSVSHARAGAHMIAPSDMMDGRIGSIRAALDEAGFADTPIMSYAAKYSSAFYGPFRDAQDSAPEMGDRSTYQMDPANLREALREVRLDIAEGSDIVMVKPAMPYLDVIRAVREAVDVPVAAYQVSGEYAMLKAAAERGWVDERRAVRESLTAIRRAGADLTITYFAKEFAKLVR